MTPEILAARFCTYKGSLTHYDCELLGGIRSLIRAAIAEERTRVRKAEVEPLVGSLREMVTFGEGCVTERQDCGPECCRYGRARAALASTPPAAAEPTLSCGHPRAALDWGHSINDSSRRCEWCADVKTASLAGASSVIVSTPPSAAEPIEKIITYIKVCDHPRQCLKIEGAHVWCGWCADRAKSAPSEAVRRLVEAARAWNTRRKSGSATDILIAALAAVEREIGGGA